MGLLKHLLFWPVTGPLFLMDFSLGRVEGVVREELTDDTSVKADLLELQLQLELGDINDDEYVAREAALMYRLREIREWRERFGMGVSGGPVRVVSAQEDLLPAGEDLTQLPTPESAAAAQVAKPGEATIDLHLDWE
jgi:hypothetical protein